MWDPWIQPLLLSLLSGGVASVLCFFGIVYWVNRRALRRVTGHNALGDLAATAIVTVVVAWMPALVAGGLVWAVVFCLLRSGVTGHDVRATALVCGGVAAGILLLVGPWRGRVLHVVFGAEEGIPTEEIDGLRPGDMARFIAARRRRTIADALLSMLARSERLRAKICRDGAYLESDLDAIEKAALRALRSRRRFGDTAFMDAFSTRLHAMEALLWTHLERPVEDRIARLFSVCPGCDVFVFAQALPEPAGTQLLPALGELRPQERDTLRAAALRRLETDSHSAVPPRRLPPVLSRLPIEDSPLVQALMLEDPKARAGLCHDVLEALAAADEGEKGAGG